MKRKMWLFIFVCGLMASGCKGGRNFTGTYSGAIDGSWKDKLSAAVQVNRDNEATVTVTQNGNILGVNISGPAFLPDCHLLAVADKQGDIKIMSDRCDTKISGSEKSIYIVSGSATSISANELQITLDGYPDISQRGDHSEFRFQGLKK